jgi:hypothetical protein
MLVNLPTSGSHIGRLEILHPNRFRDPLEKSIADFRAGLFFKDRS